MVLVLLLLEYFSKVSSKCLQYVIPHLSSAEGSLSNKVGRVIEYIMTRMGPETLYMLFSYFTSTSIALKEMSWLLVFVIVHSST